MSNEYEVFRDAIRKLLDRTSAINPAFTEIEFSHATHSFVHFKVTVTLNSLGHDTRVLFVTVRKKTYKAQIVKNFSGEVVTRKTFDDLENFCKESYSGVL